MIGTIGFPGLDIEAKSELVISPYKLGKATDPPQARAALTEALSILEQLD